MNITEIIEAVKKRESNGKYLSDETPFDLYALNSRKYRQIMPNETDAEFEARPFRPLPVVHGAIRKISEAVYESPPDRDWSGPEAEDAALKSIYASNQINAVLTQAETYANLSSHGLALIEVHDWGSERQAADPYGSPVKLVVWPQTGFRVWLDPYDPYVPVGVATFTRDSERNTTTVEVWTATEHRTLVARDSFKRGEYVDITPPDQSQNRFGVVPFVVWPRSSVSPLAPPVAIGPHLSEVELQATEQLSNLAVGLKAHTIPYGFARGIDERSLKYPKPGKFNPLRADAASDITGVMPDAFYASAAIDVAGVWEDTQNYINENFRNLGLPLTFKIEPGEITSGVAIHAMQGPLNSLTVSRQFQVHGPESALARVSLVVAGHAGKGRLTLTFPPIRSPVRTADDDARIERDLKYGFVDEIAVISSQTGKTDREAIAYLKMLKDRRPLVRELLGRGNLPASSPPPAAPPALEPPADE